MFFAEDRLSRPRRPALVVFEILRPLGQILVSLDDALHLSAGKREGLTAGNAKPQVRRADGQQLAGQVLIAGKQELVEQSAAEQGGGVLRKSNEVELLQRKWFLGTRKEKILRS